MKVSPRGDSWEEGYDLVTGQASASLLSPAMTKAELAAYKRELKAKDAKRKPAGFAPWPKDAEVPLSAPQGRSKAKPTLSKGNSAHIRRGR